MYFGSGLFRCKGFRQTDDPPVRTFPGHFIRSDADGASSHPKIAQIDILNLIPSLSQSLEAHLYPRILPLLQYRTFPSGATLLGYQAEGPFLNPSRSGCHPPGNLLPCPGGYQDFLDVYGREALEQPGIKAFTVAPEIEGVIEAVGMVTRNGGLVSMGHVSNDPLLCFPTPNLTKHPSARPAEHGNRPGRNRMCPGRGKVDNSSL